MANDSASLRQYVLAAAGRCPKKHVVSFSGGIGSWGAARRLRDRLGPDEPITLLFADTKIEDEDTYRFLHEASADVQGDLVIVADGRTPWEVFRDERMIGNSRIDPCSKILKREIMDRWIEDNCKPGYTTIYLGIDWTEEHRLVRNRERRKPWRIEAPLCDAPLITKNRLFADLAARGIKRPRLYDMGFHHGNCGGFCVKAGHAHYATLLAAMPERYAFHEAKEQEMRAFLGRDDVAILKDRRGGITRPLTMRELRERIEREGALKGDDLFDFGGCGCALEDDAHAA